jgi:hypothetical protein
MISYTDRASVADIGAVAPTWDGRLSAIAKRLSAPFR